jgi:hypothetical protein
MLDDLPDRPRLGINLILIGLVVTGFRFAWPRLDDASFLRASAIFFRFEQHVHFSHYPISSDALGIYLLVISLMCVVGGAFIFFRRGFWWVAEHRSDESITELKFK